ncbi:hypothetical protein Acid345_1853 [Candidatus Koribacter versatilis Ellin345]|uniref:RsbT co-antagonist protein RsbRD N-terminal domain-containing protein n=1 Tax=Koribacter versatilis (strain Ellin345) TaxID=204669 RepID=Q1IQJ6_KORVE|nr:hypothetical protein [Candidatus Koribacter versatilis]ABF40854.1 hypothetical protein Acid345_1853 [Candidatus Koribacter versatilis Ellin345]
MVTLKLVRLIESHCDDLAADLAERLHRSSRTAGFLVIPRAELVYATRDLYRNLGDWMLSKTEAEIENRFVGVGKQRYGQKVPIDDVVWGIIMSKETLFGYLRHESFADHALDLFNEREFLQLLDGFFDRAIYYAVRGYAQAKTTRAVA